MKGIILNVVEEAVTAEFGEAAWPSLVDAAGVSGIYTSLGSYPDEDVLALVAAASEALAISQEEVLHWIGRAAVPLMAKRYGNFFEGHRNARGFVLSVNDIIHPEVRKLYSGAGCPHFHFSDAADGRLIVGYQSPRRLCHLAHGFIEGASAHFQEHVSIEHIACMNTGSPICRLAVDWAAGGVTAEAA